MKIFKIICLGVVLVTGFSFKQEATMSNINLSAFSYEQTDDSTSSQQYLAAGDFNTGSVDAGGKTILRRFFMFTVFVSLIFAVGLVSAILVFLRYLGSRKGN